MAEPETDDLALSVFQSVRALSSDAFEDIMHRHYGSDAIPKETPRTTLTEGCKNLSAYLRVTHQLGKREEAVTEIREAHREMMRRGKTGLDEIEGEAEPRDSSQADNAEIEAAEALMELECAGRYVDALECNTTRSCYLEIGIHPPYHCRHEGWSDEDNGADGTDDEQWPEGRVMLEAGESDPMRGEATSGPATLVGLLPISESVEDGTSLPLSESRLRTPSTSTATAPNPNLSFTETRWEVLTRPAAAAYPGELRPLGSPCTSPAESLLGSQAIRFLIRLRRSPGARSSHSALRSHKNF
ncbi:hypothetical protein Q5P01_020004 [Channa striata]|uniref:Uncharacterized protein n=1 Tax=Channa striata TaxID=64152 RepID=A0AA88S8H1_CHASR|nr:hypothetical protein Q5P01_020004 [Channa striata]